MYQYDSRGQVTAGQKYWQDDTAVEELSRAVLVGRKSVQPVARRIDLGVGEEEASYALRLSRRQADMLLQQAAATQDP